MFRWLIPLLQWWYRETPVSDYQGRGTEAATGYDEGHAPVRWEINVSKNGKHVFATDGSIRRYPKEDIAALVELFTVSFPDCQISVIGRTTGTVAF